MRKTLIIVLILTLVSCQNKPSTVSIYRQIGIVERDSLFYIAGSFYSYDSVSMVHADGFLINPGQYVSRYNESLLYLSNSQIIPKAEGVSKIMFRFPDGKVDSIKMEITKLNGRLVVMRLPA